MPLISGKPTLFASRRSTVLVGLCVLTVSLGILPTTLGRTASVTLANRVTFLLGFGCLEAVWTTWPDTPPAWRMVSTHSDRTRSGQFEWAPSIRTARAATGPIHSTVVIPFWLILIPAAAVASLSMRRSAQPEASRERGLTTSA